MRPRSPKTAPRVRIRTPEQNRPTDAVLPTLVHPTARVAAPEPAAAASPPPKDDDEAPDDFDHFVIELQTQAKMIRVGGNVSKLIAADGKPGYDVLVESDDTSVDLDKATGCYKFVEWSSNIPDEFLVKKIAIQSVDMFGPKNVGFIKLKADVVNRATEARPLPAPRPLLRVI